MKLTIERDVLLNTLKATVGIVDKKTTVPITAHVRIKAHKKTADFTATDLDMEITKRAEANIIDGGAVCVRADTLKEIASKLPSDVAVTIEAKDNGKVIVSAKRSRFQLDALPADDFPTMEVTHEINKKFSIPADIMQRMFHHVVFAASTEETRYYLNGVYMHSCNEGLCTVATNGHILAKTLGEHLGTTAPGVIIPTKAVQHLPKAFPADETELLVEVFSNTRVKVSGPNTCFITKTIDGTFPDYSRIIPASSDKTLTIDRAAFREAIDRVAIMASERSRGIEFKFGKDKITISLQNPEGGTAQEEMPCTHDAEGFTVKVNYEYMLQTLGTMDGQSVTFSFTDEGSPILAKPQDSDASIYVIMPMR